MQSSSFYYCALVFIGYFLFNLNRRCIIYQFPKLLPEFGLTATDAGTMSSAQHFSTSLLTFFGGVLSDIIPSQILFPFGLIVCGVSSILFPLGSSTIMFSTFMFINGIGQGLRLPTALRLTKQISEPSKFATNWSIVLIGVNVAGITTPIIAATTSSLNWASVVRSSGFLTLAFGLFMLKELQGICSESDAMSKKSDDKKNVKDDKKNNENTNSTSSSRIALTTIFSFPILWIVISNYFTTGFYRMSLDWTSLYFNEQNLGPNSAHLYVTLFEGASVIGKLLSGRINDYYMKRKGATDTPALIRVPIVFAFSLLLLLAQTYFSLLLGADSSIILLGVTAILTGISSSANVVTLSVLSTEISDKSCTGLVSSICTTSTKVGAFVSGYPLTVIALYFGWRGANLFILMLISIFTFLTLVFHVRSSSLPKNLIQRKLKIQ